MAKATIGDVAIRAGVSKTTASRVLNGAHRVDPVTRQRVLDTMAELDYTPSNAARRLSFGRTSTITVVTSFLTRPQAAERLRGIEAVLSDSEFDLVINNVETVEKRDQYLQGLALAQRTDGLLIISLPPRPDDLVRLAAAAIPVVVVDAHAPVIEGLPHVIGDDTAGGAAAAEHLIRLGHRRIAYVGDEFDNPFGFTSSRHRFLGLEQALAASGIALPSEFIALGAHSRYEAGSSQRRSCGEMIVRVPSSPPVIRRHWVSSVRRMRPASGFPKTFRSSATTTSRSRSTWASRPSASSSSNPDASALRCCSPKSDPAQPLPHPSCCHQRS